MKFTKDGSEFLSQVPLAIPYDKTRPESLQEQIARMVQSRWSDLANNNQQETFEEANDFGDDLDDYITDAPLTQFQEEYLSSPEDNRGKDATDNSTAKPSNGSVEGAASLSEQDASEGQ